MIQLLLFSYRDSNNFKRLRVFLLKNKKLNKRTIKKPLLNVLIVILKISVQ